MSAQVAPPPVHRRTDPVEHLSGMSTPLIFLSPRRCSQGAQQVVAPREARCPQQTLKGRRRSPFKHQDRPFLQIPKCTSQKTQIPKSHKPTPSITPNHHRSLHTAFLQKGPVYTFRPRGRMRKLQLAQVPNMPEKVISGQNEPK